MKTDAPHCERRRPYRRRLTARALIALACFPLTLAIAPAAAGEPTSVEQAVRRVDGFLESHWNEHWIKPAAPSSDAAFLRRLTLDLAGRIPTAGEVDRFLADKSKDKRRKRIEALSGGHEFPLHFGNVLDRMLQGRHAGNASFVDYLRRRLRDDRGWDSVFREIMLGPWDNDDRRPASRFLDKRAKTLDTLTSDATRVFFGVDISCAKCHDHPLVDEWKQEHFYGMASFFNRTTGGKGKVGEKQEGVVTFAGLDGKERTARLMFLSGVVIEEPPSEKETSKDKKTSAQSKGKKEHKRFSRRQELVNVALSQKTFFSRSIINRVWRHFFGRGLVDPVDQMHSANKPAVAGLLEWLSEDLAASGYDIRRLAKVIVSTRAYGLSSRWTGASKPPRPEMFAVARLRPLSRHQLAFSLLMATGAGKYDAATEIDSRIERYVSVAGLNRIQRFLELEDRAKGLLGAIDPRSDRFQSSAAEALFMSNNEAAQELVRADGDNLAARLAKMNDADKIVASAVKTILSRPVGDEERQRLADWFKAQGSREEACGLFVWALATSAEFRFNH